MPLLARFYIKTGLVYLVAALAIAALLAAQPLLALPSALHSFSPVYMHLLTIGWISQLIFGVAYWMFPKFSKEQPRRSERLGWAVYVLLNSGLLLRAVAEPLTMIQPQLGVGWLLVVSAILQLAAGWGFVINTWSRVKER